MRWMEWYAALRKPSWTPAPGTIGTIWSILYPIIFVCVGFVLVQAIRGKLPWRVVLPFMINLAANLLFMPIFAGLKILPLATICILIVLITIPWSMASVWKHHKWVALVQTPYLLWVSIATVLQISITAMNWGST